MKEKLIPVEVEFPVAQVLGVKFCGDTTKVTIALTDDPRSSNKMTIDCWAHTGECLNPVMGFWLLTMGCVASKLRPKVEYSLFVEADGFVHAHGVHLISEAELEELPDDTKERVKKKRSKKVPMGFAI